MKNYQEIFLAISLSYSVVKLARLSDAFSEIFELEASPEDAQSAAKREKK